VAKIDQVAMVLGDLNQGEEGAAMSDDVFQPTNEILESGVYQVQHYRHRLYHEVTILRGDTFPLCSECGNNVRFRLVKAAPEIRFDRNFQSKLGVGLD
jgi:hypothetical protein